MNLICFPHYTCGGLLCDILNETFSRLGANGGINSIHHSLGKIGDADTVLTDYDSQQLIQAVKNLQCDPGTWIGTHCWPGQLDLDIFDQVIVVTTTTSRSKLYRWVRAYYHYYSKSKPWTQTQAQDRIDKERETAKNYLVSFDPVIHPRAVNIEFAEIVENSVEFRKLMGKHQIDTHLDRWRVVNSFLYSHDMWTSVPAQRLYEAELESNLGQYYVYK